MPTGAEQAAIIRALGAAGNYPGAYRAIAAQIRGNPNWDQRLSTFFEDAAEINGPEDNFNKRQVFNHNAIASGMNPDSPEAFEKSQLASNVLARDLIERYARAVESNQVLTPREIYNRDTTNFSEQFELPPHMWAGGPEGERNYGFPVPEHLNTPEKVEEWANVALKALSETASDYAEDARDYFLNVWNSFANFWTDDDGDIFDLIIDLVRDFLSDPLVLDLDGDGIELTALATSATFFDLDDDGVAERTGWVGPHDGLLVHDANRNGLVDGVGELFGSANVDGYDELKTIDANNDGRIDALDPAFADLRVWRDLNSDGVSSADEMLTLAQAGIARFNLAYSQVDTDVAGNVVARKGSYVRADGSARAMASVNFALDETGNVPAIPTGADLGTLPTLPNLSPGGSALPDLRTAMYFDPVLKAMVENLVYGSHDFDTFAEFQEGERLIGLDGGAGDGDWLEGRAARNVIGAEFVRRSRRVPANGATTLTMAA